MAEYASKGVGTGGLTTGIIGTSLAGLLALNNGNGGLLGNLFGNNNQNERISELMSENTQLKSRVYTDGEVKQLNSEICNLRSEVQRQGAEINCINKTSALREEITDGKIARVADASTCGINNLRCSIECLQNTVAGITRVYVPAAQVTPLPAPYPFPPTPPYSPYPFPPFVPPIAPNSGTNSGTTDAASNG